MNKVDSIRLVMFIVFGMAIYLYMGNMFASQSSLLTRKYVENSYSIWKMIDEIEDSLSDVYPKSVFLGEGKKKQLKVLALSYDIDGFVDGLISAYEQGDIKRFAEYKEKIAQKLRPIWQTAIYDERKKEQERKAKEGWMAWIKNNITYAAHRFYYYFFPVAEKK